MYACQRLVLGHHWPVASHQLAVVGRIWLVAVRLVRHVANVQSHLSVIAARLPAGNCDLLTTRQLQFIAETCAGPGRFECRVLDSHFVGYREDSKLLILISTDIY
jgi:hypothetical protein